jgi:uncharacterized protein YdhG (YjbR/CyaY superfamily)
MAPVKPGSPKRAAPAGSADADGAKARAWIDAYLADLPADQRAALQNLRETIAVGVPDVIEATSYGMPAFRHHGRTLTWYMAAKAHCSLFPGAAAIDAYRAELAGFGLSKGTVRFTPDHPLPADLVVRLVRHRLAELDADKSE